MEQGETAWEKLLKGRQIASLIVGVVVGFFMTAPDGIPGWLFNAIVILVVSLTPYAIYRALFAPVPTIEERDRTPPADHRRWLR